MSKHYDIVIAGGGIIGSAVAYYLSKNTGHSIALIDIKKPGNAT
ncbi:MAG: FAD-dependent oxidoreductase, partial [Methyloprofundus sp.]|nr:FAD-dependent oxidoreductase [Methyloprofundus sp.]